MAISEFINENVKARFFRKVSKTETCWIWLGNHDHHGYGLMSIGGRAGRQHPAHRISYTMFVGPIPDGLLVCHTCDVRNCVNPDHLFIGTSRDNTQDMIAKGRNRWSYGDQSGARTKPWALARGERIASSKLTEDAVREMRRLREVERLTIVELGLRFGVHHAVVSRVLRKLAWAHVD